jgi:polar amino acid transport system permease protein
MPTIASNWERVLTPVNIERLLVGDLFTRGEPGGLLLTLIIGILAIIFATLLGALLGAMRASPRRRFWMPAMAYIELLRNVPALLLVFWAYFVPPYFGYEPSKFVSVTVALSLFTAAYVAEIVRGGILAVSRGTIEAASALGLNTFQIYFWIVWPEAFFKMLPALSGRYIVTIKNTSLAFLIGLSELTDIGRQINSRLMVAPIEVFGVLMVLYFVVNKSLSSLFYQLEDKFRFNRVQTWLGLPVAPREGGPHRAQSITGGRQAGDSSSI